MADDDIMSFTTAQARAKAEAEADGHELKLLEFDVDGETFHAAPFPPGGALLDAAAVASARTSMDRLQLVGKFLDAVLTSDSAERFSRRLRSGDKPIDLATASQVVVYLVEKYGGRPTEPSSPSAVG